MYAVVLPFCPSGIELNIWGIKLRSVTLTWALGEAGSAATRGRSLARLTPTKRKGRPTGAPPCWFVGTGDRGQAGATTKWKSYVRGRTDRIYCMCQCRFGRRRLAYTAAARTR
jgi:hypothetical protein